MPKAKLELDIDKVDAHPVVDHEECQRREAELVAMLATLAEVTGQINANGVHSKDRCYDCAVKFTHGDVLNCSCVCHEVRKYLTQYAVV